jgi:hypothetical protein
LANAISPSGQRDLLDDYTGTLTSRLLGELLAESAM